MKRFLLLLSLLQCIHCSCPDGFKLVRDGECRGEYVEVDVADRDATNMAVAKCKEIQAQPVIIHNQEHQDYWTSLGNEFPIGLLCNSSTMKWQWADESAVDYKLPIRGGSESTSLDGTCKTGCSWFAYKEGLWGCYCGGSTFNKPIFCTTQSVQLDLTSGCQTFEDDSDDGVCYQVGEAADDWQDAQMICRKLGANLASIHNLQENAFVRRLAVSKGAVNGLFLGASISGKGNDFAWVDGTEWDYDNFFPGFPRADFGGCIAMDTSTSSGQWMNVDCTDKLPVACIRGRRSFTGPNATCSTETWKEGSIITSPGYPSSASTPCEYFLEVDAGKKVEVEIVLLEANSCCDNLILYDGYLGGIVLANLTGEIRNVTYTTTSSNLMRVTWAPNGGVNVMGMAMTFRGV